MEICLILCGGANLAILLWLAAILVAIRKNTKTTAEYVRWIAICHPPNQEQRDVIRAGLLRTDDVSPVDVDIARIREGLG